MSDDADLRAYRFALDLTSAQLASVRQHAGAARWAYNHALGVKFAALDARIAVISQLVEQGVDPAAARAQAPKVPGKAQIQKALNVIKGDDRRGGRYLAVVASGVHLRLPVRVPRRRHRLQERVGQQER